MSSISLQEVTTKKQLKEFVKFQWKLYQGVPAYVPPVMDFELSTLSKDKNPFFKIGEAKYWIAYKNKKPVGRVAAIIHPQEATDKSLIRFGWLDFEDDPEISKALLQKVQEWGYERSLTGLHGPLGFTDLDFEGMLISGFDEISTQATFYNYPYYQKHMEAMGFEKAVDWVESRIKVPPGFSEKFEKASQTIQKRYQIKLKKFKKGKELLPYADQVFDILNNAYGHLYGYYPLSNEQIKYYIDQYFGFVKAEFIPVVFDKDDNVLGFAITFPSLSKAFQKAKGSLFPFGFIHVLKAFYYFDTIDMFLVAVKKGHQNKGVHVVMWNGLYQALVKHKVKYIFSGQMLEENLKVNNLLSPYESILTEEIRRRCFKKRLEP